MIGPYVQSLPRQIDPSSSSTGARFSFFDTAARIHPLHGLRRTSEYKLADNMYERAAAFRLTYRKYVTTGLIEPNAYRMRVTPFHLLPSTHVFVSIHKGNLTATLTLVGDGVQGLPMECVYADEVNRLRAKGYSVAEVGCLAFESANSKRRFWPAFMHLNRLMAQFARQRGIDGLLIAIHPRHLDVYRRLMGFEQIGPVRSYPSVCNHPAVACWLDFAKVDSERPPCYESIFGEPIPVGQLRGRPISASERRFFHPASQLAGPCLPLAAAC